VGTSFIRFVTIHAFDIRTDRQMDNFLVARPCCMQCVQCSKN